MFKLAGEDNHLKRYVKFEHSRSISLLNTNIWATFQ